MTGDITRYTKARIFSQIGKQTELFCRMSTVTGERGAADHWNYREDDDDYYAQPRALFRLMSPAQQQVLFDNTARSLGGAAKALGIAPGEIGR